jgi:hypothetical protein
MKSYEMASRRRRPRTLISSKAFLSVDLLLALLWDHREERCQCTLCGQPDSGGLGDHSLLGGGLGGGLGLAAALRLVGGGDVGGGGGDGGVLHCC